MISVCAFDLGNTLVNDSELYDSSIRRLSEVLHTRGIVPDAAAFVAAYDGANRAASAPFISHTFGEPDFFRAAFAQLDVTGIAPAEALEIYRETVTAETKIHPDILDALAWLRGQGIRLAILSNERTQRVDRCLAVTGTRGLFDLVHVSEAVGAEKPDGRFFTSALERLGAQADEVLMYGDNTVSDGACRNHGIRFVHVTAYQTRRWYFEKGAEHEPDYVIPALTRASVQECLQTLDPDRGPARSRSD